MKSCLRIPRLFLPRENFEEWASPPCDGMTAPSVRRESGALSALSLVVPDGEEGLRENGYSALESGVLRRVERGFMLVRRTYAQGERAGILAAIDLEGYSPSGGKDAAVRPSTQTDGAIVAARLAARREQLLEFPHTVLAYRDKRNKIMRWLEGGELDVMYDFAPAKGERLQGAFLPAFVAEEVARDLMHFADPCFGVLDGNHSLAAAKLYWEEVKRTLSSDEARNHPARFTLAEFVNLADDAVGITPAGEGAPARKEDLLSVWKTGRLLPSKCFCLAAPRYCLEGREISYD